MLLEVVERALYRRRPPRMRRALQRAATAATRVPNSFVLSKTCLLPFLAEIERAKHRHSAWATAKGQAALIAVAARHAHLLPEDIRVAIERTQYADANPCVLIRGLPIGEALPAIHSPLLDQLKAGDAVALHDALAVQAAFGSIAGQQYTFAAERGDNMFHLVLPTQLVPSDSQSSVGPSAVNLHTEDPIPPIDELQPRTLTLLMLRAAREASVTTMLATVDSCAADLLALPARLLDTLSAEQFRHPVPDVFTIMGREAPDQRTDGRAPVLYARAGGDGLEVPCILLQVCTCIVHSTCIVHTPPGVCLTALLTRHTCIVHTPPGVCPTALLTSHTCIVQTDGWNRR